MQTSRIKPGNYYQTKQGIGKCVSTAGKKLFFEIDGKKVYMSSSEVQHEIAKGEEPQDLPAAEYRHCPHCQGRTLHVHGEAPPVICVQCGRSLIHKQPPAKEEPTDARAAYIAHLEEELAEVKQIAADRASGDPTVRDLLLYEFGTTDEKLLAEQIGSMRTDRSLLKAEKEKAEEDCAKLKSMNAELLQSLEFVMQMIATDDLIPEEVSYMRLARATIKKAKGEKP